MSIPCPSFLLALSTSLVNAFESKSGFVNWLNVPARQRHAASPYRLVLFFESRELDWNPT